MPSIFGKVWKWLKKTFKNVITHAAPVAVTVTEEIKTVLESGATGFIASLIDGLTKTNIASEIVAFLNKEIPKILAAELAVEALPLNPTEDDIAIFEANVLKAFGVYDNKSKLYTTLAAQIFGIIQQTYNDTPDVPPTFAEWVKAVEQAWQDYQNDIQNSDNEQH